MEAIEQSVVDDIIAIAIERQEREALLMGQMKQAYLSNDRDMVFTIAGQLCGMITPT